MKGTMKTFSPVKFLEIYFMLALVVGIFLVCSVARAAPLDLVPIPPDIAAGFIDVTYDATSKQFSASGFAASLNDDGFGDHLSIPEADISANYFISAEIDNSGNIVSGDITINGTVSELSYSSGLLLTGDLTGLVGYTAPGAGDILNFLFDVTGGDAQGLYGPEGGINLSLGSLSNFSGSFEGSFDNNFGMSGMGQGVSDTFKVIPSSPIPIPGAGWLFGSGLIGLVGLRKKFGKR